MNYQLLSKNFKKSIIVAMDLDKLLFNKIINSCQSKIDLLRMTLYRRIILISENLYKLLPVDETEYFSLTSIGSLTRVLVESYRPFYYLTIEDITDEERDFRYLIFEVYLLIERRNMIQAIRNTSNRDPVLETELAGIKQKIINHSFYIFLSKSKNNKSIYCTLFQSIEDTVKEGPKKNIGFSKGLTEKIQQWKGCLKDDETILVERLAIYNLSDEERNKIKNRFDNFFSKLMSNYVHSSAFAISMEHDSNFKLNQEVEHYINQMVSCCIFYLITATHDLLQLCQLSQENDLLQNLIQECEKAEDGAGVFLSILVGNSTSAETNP
jgi:hypothetical protein